MVDNNGYINANSYLELAGHTLTTFYLTITNKIYQPGFYTAAQLGALVLDNSGGTGKLSSWRNKHFSLNQQPRYNSA